MRTIDNDASQKTGNQTNDQANSEKVEMSATEKTIAKSRVALLSVASNTLLTVSKVVIGLLSGTVSILSEGIHSGIDLLAAGIAFFAVRESGKPADSHHAYGHGKIENVSGTIEALLIFIAAIWIIWEAIQKIIILANGGDTEVRGMALIFGMVVMGCSALVNVFVSARLMKVAKLTDSVALEADALHLRTDVFTSTGVFLGVFLIMLTGWHILDPIIALVVAAMILHAAFGLLKKAFSPLMDTSLPDLERETIHQIIAHYADSYIEFHDLRTRKSGSERYADLHLVVPKSASVGEVHELCDMIEQDIREQLQGTQVLIHAEPCNADNMVCPFKKGESDHCLRCQARLNEV